MKQSKSHPILAAFVDYYFISLVLMGLITLMNAVTKKIYLEQYVFVGFFFVLLVGVILYHAWLNKKTRFLSYGERLAGKVLTQAQKEWKNPYNKNRLILFMVILISFFSVGSTWNRVIFLVPTLGFLVGSTLKLALIFLGAYLIGRGRIIGAFVMMPPFLVGAFFMFSAYRVYGSTFYISMLMLFVALLVGLLSIFFMYRKK